MKPFLYSIAEAYLSGEPENIAEYCFVFPNKRSGVFFHHAMARAQKQLGIETPHPASTTISDFIESLTAGKKGERLEMIMILYQSYREVIYRYCGENRQAREIAEMVDFNKFQRWADMLIGDFNDVDMYLVDPEEIFPNIEHYREISANYIEPEVMEEIRRHWHPDRIPEFSDAFWNHIIHQTAESDSSDEEKRGSAVSFFRLWQVMLDLYKCFRRKLSEAGICYPGMAYREAVEKAKEMSRAEFPFRRYIFVGFNMLSKAEEKIFAIMRDKPAENIFDSSSRFADFYFDDASPAFRMAGNTTAAFIEKYRKAFPSLYDCVKPISSFPRIEICGVASKIGQTKLAGGIAGLLYPEGGQWNEDTLRHTAIVLPQESLASSIVAAIPQWVSPVNLTMGYRLRDSRAASLVKDIISLHLRSRKSRGVTPTFFYEDVLTVLTHPMVRQIFPKECSRLIYEINVNRLYNIEVTLIQERFPALMEIFRYVESPSSPMEVFDYFKHLFTWLLSSWKVTPGDEESGAVSNEKIDIDGHDLAEDTPVKGAVMVDRMLTRAYLAAIERLRSLVSRYLRDKDIFLADTTIFQMMERLVGGETVNFEGRPLNGLQVMGVLESRGLDFENIIIPSMNEKIFPRKHYTKSFIPPHIRSAYGMSTQEHQESIYSYYFYRMISRARRVFLLYDARTQGVGGGQMSRYLNQLIHLYRPAGLTSRVIGYSVESREEILPEIPKSPRIMAHIERYRSKENPLYLSASSINLYINCPLSFYLSYIEGYKREDEFHDYMDESTYGTILHGVLEDLYKTERSNNPSVIFDGNALRSLMNKTVEIEKAITRRINRHYNRLGEDCLTPLRGDAEIFGKVMKKYIKLLMRREIEAGPFDFLAGEFGEKMRLMIRGTGEETTINFRYSIDRVDRLVKPDGSTLLRVIDYKTGSDSTDIIELADMFRDRNSNTMRAKAMLQLFLYCQAYAQTTGHTDAIQPWIYSIRKVSTTALSPLKISEVTEPGKKPNKVFINDYRDYVVDFNDLMLDVLSDLFNPEIPFAASGNPHACTYCNFAEICRKHS